MRSHSHTPACLPACLSLTHPSTQPSTHAGRSTHIQRTLKGGEKNTPRYSHSLVFDPVTAPLDMYQSTARKLQHVHHIQWIPISTATSTGIPNHADTPHLRQHVLTCPHSFNHSHIHRLERSCSARHSLQLPHLAVRWAFPNTSTYCRLSCRVHSYAVLARECCCCSAGCSNTLLLMLLLSWLTPSNTVLRQHHDGVLLRQIHR